MAIGESTISYLMDQVVWATMDGLVWATMDGHMGQCSAWIVGTLLQLLPSQTGNPPNLGTVQSYGLGIGFPMLWHRVPLFCPKIAWSWTHQMTNLSNSTGYHMIPPFFSGT
ncbi:hypothetical protein SUGI_1029150 [Cryptomeria japonica]|nr:hypothetical protein SUGI_1029150 [Cryptomeria japonica]